MCWKVSLRKVIILVGIFCLAVQTKKPTLLLDSSAFFADPTATFLYNKSRQQDLRNDAKSMTIVEHNNSHISQSSVSAYYFPKFIEKYVAFHNEQRLHPNAKYLIWRCPRGTSCGGTGDRIKGIVTAFYTALCTGRVLLIDWPLSETPNVTPFLSPHRIDWTIPPNVQTQLYTQTVPLYSAIDNYNNPWFKNLTIPTSFYNHPVIDMRSNLWSEHVKAVVRVNDTQCIQQQWQHEPLLVYTTSTTHINPPHYMQDKYLFRMGFWAMFTFSKAIHERKRAMQTRARLLLPDAVAISHSQSNEQRAAQALRLENNQQFEQNQPTLSIAGEDTAMQPYIAVHIRTGIGSSWKDPLRHGSQEDYKQFYQCAKRLQLGIYQRQRQAASTCGSSSNSNSNSASTNFDYDYQRPLPLLPLYIAADNIVAKQAMIKLEEEARAQQQLQPRQQAGPTNFINRTIRVIEDMQIYHIDRSQKQGNDAELTVWAELNVLLESTCLVASRSGFSDLATWLQPATAKRCAVMFNQCDDESIVQNALDALEFSCPNK